MLFKVLHEVSAPSEALHLKKKLAGRSETVASGELPHARKELSETTAEESHTDDDVGGVDTARINIVKRQNERRGREGVETTVGSTIRVSFAPGVKGNF